MNHPARSPSEDSPLVRLLVRTALLATSGLAAWQAALAAPTLSITEQVMEMAVISYRVDPRGSGVASVRGCRVCEESVTLHITRDTRLFVDGREIRLQALPVLDRRRATLYYSLAAQRLNRIVLRGPSPTD